MNGPLPGPELDQDISNNFKINVWILESIDLYVLETCWPISTHIVPPSPPLPLFHLRFRRLCILAAAGADRFHGNKHNKLLQLNWTGQNTPGQQTALVMSWKRNMIRLNEKLYSFKFLRGYFQIKSIHDLLIYIGI